MPTDLFVVSILHHRLIIGVRGNIRQLRGHFLFLRSWRWHQFRFGYLKSSKLPEEKSDYDRTRNICNSAIDIIHCTKNADLLLDKHTTVVLRACYIEEAKFDPKPLIWSLAHRATLLLMEIYIIQ